MTLLDPKKTTNDTELLLYAELGPAAIRAAQRRVLAGQLTRILPGMASSCQAQDWPALIARERLRVLAALFAGTVLGYRSAFNGGVPEDGVIHLIGSYRRSVSLPGLTVMLWKCPPPAWATHRCRGAIFFIRLCRACCWRT